jgi:hypothetical protein
METKSSFGAEREKMIADVFAILEARRPRVLTIMAMLSIIVAAFFYCADKIGTLAEAYNHVREALNPAPNGMEVWAAGAKDQFSREFLAVGWRRWEATNTFIYVKEQGGAEKASMDSAFNIYLLAVNEWNARYTTNLAGLEFYYSKRVPELRKNFDETIPLWFTAIHECVLALARGASQCGFLPNEPPNGTPMQAIKDYQCKVFYHLYLLAKLNPKPSEDAARNIKSNSAVIEKEVDEIWTRMDQGWANLVFVKKENVWAKDVRCPSK